MRAPPGNRAKSSRIGAVLWFSFGSKACDCCGRCTASCGTGTVFRNVQFSGMSTVWLKFPTNPWARPLSSHCHAAAVCATSAFRPAMPLGSGGARQTLPARVRNDAGPAAAPVSLLVVATESAASSSSSGGRSTIAAGWMARTRCPSTSSTDGGTEPTVRLSGVTDHRAALGFSTACWHAPARGHLGTSTACWRARARRRAQSAVCARAW